MKPMNVAKTVCYAEDASLTAEFYNKLGFDITQDDSDHLSVNCGTFWMDFHPQEKEDKPEFQEEANIENKGAGLFLYFKVDDVDTYHAGLFKQGLEPSIGPKKLPVGQQRIHHPRPGRLQASFLSRKHLNQSFKEELNVTWPILAGFKFLIISNNLRH